MFKKIFFLIIFLSIFADSYSQTAEEIINKSLMASGYTKNSKKINTLKVKLKVSYTGAEQYLTIWNKRPNLYRMEMEMFKNSIIEAYNGKEAWAG
ncbi:MAG: hypothetical protein WCT77_02645, partial [Bacteroidota bacterium]